MAELTNQRRRAWVGPVVGLGLLTLMLVLCVGAIGRLGFIKHHEHHRYDEAWTNLKAAFRAETEFRRKNGRYEESIETVGFLPERGNRYRYLFSRTDDSVSPRDPPDGGAHTGILADTWIHSGANNALLLSAIPPALLSTAGIDGTGITIIAAGDIDSDPTIDVWSISTNNRLIDGGIVSAGVPFRHVNDTEY